MRRPSTLFATRLVTLINHLESLRPGSTYVPSAHACQMAVIRKGPLVTTF